MRNDNARQAALQQLIQDDAPGYHQNGLLHVQVVTEATQPAQDRHYILSQPSLASEEYLHHD